jgi:serine/threonine-protein kinase
MSGLQGTYPYAAPELLKGFSVRGTDQFALAITVCQLIMGHRPFRKIDPAQRAVPAIPIDFTRLRESEYPVLARALTPHPASRWPSCQAFLAAFRQALEGAPRQPLVRDRDSEVQLAG